jgi:hypothetical protein
MSPKSHTQKRCGTMRKNSSSARRYAEIHIQRPVFDQKKKHTRNHCIQNTNSEHMLTCLMKREEFFPKINTKISIFSANSKSPKLIIFILERVSRNDWIR